MRNRHHSRVVTLFVATLISLVGKNAIADAGGDYSSCFTSNDSTKVLESCTGAIASGELAPSKLSEAHYRRGFAYYAIDELKNALADFDRGLELEPNSPNSFHNLAGRGAVRLRMGDARNALDDFENTLSIMSRETTLILTESWKDDLRTARAGRIDARKALGLRVATAPSRDDADAWTIIPGFWQMIAFCAQTTLVAGIHGHEYHADGYVPGIEVWHDDWIAVVLKERPGYVQVWVRGRDDREDPDLTAEVVAKLRDCPP